MEFKPMAKMARLSRECLITEKINGTNASVTIKPAHEFEGTEDASDALGDFDGNFVFAGSRTRWIKPGNDNFGFAAWVLENIIDLVKLGPGTHFGEYWGRGIQAGYGLYERRFSLFNADRWSPAPLGDGVFDNKVTMPGREFPRRGPSCVHVVPTLYRGLFTSDAVEAALAGLKEFGSKAAPGFKDPEGVVVYHVAAGFGFKKTLGSDGAKGQDSRS